MQVLIDTLRALAGLNAWGFAGLCVMCATYAYTQRMRKEYHENVQTTTRTPVPPGIDGLPPSLMLVPPPPQSPPIPEVKPPSAGKGLGVLLVLFAAGTLLRVGSTYAECMTESSLVHAADQKRCTDSSQCDVGQRCESGKCVADAHRPPRPKPQTSLADGTWAGRDVPAWEDRDIQQQPGPEPIRILAKSPTQGGGWWR